MLNVNWSFKKRNKFESIAKVFKISVAIFLVYFWNFVEYDALAIIIQQNPERKETLKQLEEVRKEIEAAEHEKRALEERV